MLPKAALLLAGAPGSERRDKGMRYLPLWAPGTGTRRAPAAVNMLEARTAFATISMSACQHVSVAVGHALLQPATERLRVSTPLCF
jgi:hypothetical protein